MSLPSPLIPYLQVVFAEGTRMTYTNPKPWTCLKFSTCSYWHRTDIVYWNRLSFKQYGIFYESGKCVSQVLYHYISDLSKPGGGKRILKKNRAIQSMMLGESSDNFRQPNITYVDNCSNNKKAEAVNESSVFVTYGSDDGSIGAENLSSSWYDELQ